MQLYRLLLPVLFGVAACVDDLAPDTVDTPVSPAPAIRLDGDRAFYGAFERGVTWPRDNLSVCWMASAWTADFATLRVRVRNAVNREWGTSGRLRFTWNESGPCSTTAPADIRIGHDPTDTGRSEIGTLAQNVPADQPTMILDFTGPPPGGCVQVPGGGGGGSGGGGGPVIARCDGIDAHTGPPPSLDVWVVATALHEFAHALGLRHEHARDDSGCRNGEVLDFSDGTRTYNGEAIWSIDEQSIMSYCAATPIAYGTTEPHISVGDLRSLHTLYPGVVALFWDSELMGSATRLGPGYYTASSLPAIGQTSSLVVPPGFTVTACYSNNQCWAYTQSVRVLPLDLNDRMTTINISAGVTLYQDAGYRGISQSFAPGTYSYGTGGLNTIGNDTTSSVWVPPTRSALLCVDDYLANGCIYVAGGLFGTSGYAMHPAMENQTSSVQVDARVVTYSDAQFRGESWSLGLGTYQVSTGSTWLTSLRAVAVQGLKVTACTAEGAYSPWLGPTCAGTCVTTQSSLNTLSGIRCLKVALPPLGAG